MTSPYIELKSGVPHMLVSNTNTTFTLHDYICHALIFQKIITSVYVSGSCLIFVYVCVRLSMFDR